MQLACLEGDGVQGGTYAEPDKRDKCAKSTQFKVLRGCGGGTSALR